MWSVCDWWGTVVLAGFIHVQSFHWFLSNASSHLVKPSGKKLRMNLSIAYTVSNAVRWSHSLSSGSHKGSQRGSPQGLGWVGLWGFLWWAPSAKGKDHHGVSSGWSSVWHRSNTGLSSTQYEQIPIILGIWPFWLTPFFFRSITFWRAYG